MVLCTLRMCILLYTARTGQIALVSLLGTFSFELRFGARTMMEHMCGAPKPQEVLGEVLGEVPAGNGVLGKVPQRVLGKVKVNVLLF